MLANYSQVNRNRLGKLIAMKERTGEFSETGERPNKCDDIGKEEIRRQIVEAEENRKPLTKQNHLNLSRE